MTTLQYASHNFGAKLTILTSFLLLFASILKAQVTSSIFSLRNSKAQTFLKRVKSCKEEKKILYFETTFKKS